MKKNDLLYLIGEADDDFVLDAAPSTEVKKQKPWVKWAALAASFAVIISAVLGGNAVIAEAAEYREAVEFFEEHALSMEGLSRDEIKKVYRDITMQTFSYDKTVTAMLNSNISVEGYELLTNAPTAEEIENYWETFYNTHKEKNGIYSCYFSSNEDSVFDTSGLQYYENDQLIWETHLSFYVADHTVCEDGTIIAYGQNDTWSSEQTRYVYLALLSQNGKLLWEKTIDNGFHNEYVSEIMVEKDTFAVFGRGDAQTFVFSRYDMEGNRLTYRATPLGEVLGIRNVVPFSGGYLVQLSNYTEGSFAKLVKVDYEGNLSDSFSYSADDQHYFLVDMIEHGGKIYLSTYAIPKTGGDTGGQYELAHIFQYIWEKKEFSISSEKLTPLVRDNYTAVLLICDTDSGKVGEFYSVDGALGAALSVGEDGNLVWNVENIIDTFFSPATSSFSIGGTSRIYRYTFDRNGTLISEEKTEEFAQFCK